MWQTRTFWHASTWYVNNCCVYIFGWEILPQIGEKQIFQTRISNAITIQKSGWIMPECFIGEYDVCHSLVLMLPFYWYKWLDEGSFINYVSLQGCGWGSNDWMRDRSQIMSRFKGVEGVHRSSVTIHTFFGKSHTL